MGNVDVFLNALPTDLGSLNLTDSSLLTVRTVLKIEGPETVEITC